MATSMAKRWQSVWRIFSSQQTQLMINQHDKYGLCNDEA